MQAEPGASIGSGHLWDEAACGLLVTSDNGTILKANQTFCRWLGYADDQLPGQRLQALLTMGGRIFHQTHWAPLLHMQGSVAEIKLDLVHRDGHTLPMMLNAIRRNHNGAMRHELALFVAKDRHKYEHELINARTLAEERLVRQLEIQAALNEAQSDLRSAYSEAEQRAELAERMVGIVSHDLRNPLSAIKMAASMLQRLDADPRQARMVSHINSSVDRAQRLIADLLDFTLAQVGRGIPVSRQPVDLHGLVGDSLDELRMAFPDNRLLHQTDGSGEFAGDSDRLYQRLGNLVANAVAYGEPHGVVTVMTRFDERSISLSVHNVGATLSQERLEQLFEPMSRGHEPSAERHNLGLGLFIVREIVKAHQGEVAVISTPDLGTTFIARFPRS